MKGKKILALLLAFGIACCTLTGCKDEPKGKPAKEIHIATSTQPPSLDATLTTSGMTAYISTHIFEKLVSLKSDYTVGLELASSYEHNDDYTEQTYKLREGVLFHNGDEMKAEDVVASMNRWIENNGQAIAMVGDGRFEAVDDYTVKIKTSNSCMYLNDLIGYLGNGFIMPKEVIDATPAGEFLTEYVGTGPYKYTEWVTDKHIRLDKFEEYEPYAEESDGWWGKKEANIQTLYYDIVVDATTRLNGIQSGDYDVAMGMPQDNYEQLDSDSNFEVHKTLESSTVLVYNKAEGICTDVNFRKAIQATLNMEELMTAGYASSDFYRLNSCDMLEEQVDWYTDAGSKYYNMQDLKLAKDYLDKSDYDGKSVKILCSSDFADTVAIATVLQEQLKEIGVKTKIEQYDFATFLNCANDPSSGDIIVATYAPVMVPSMILYMSPESGGWYNDDYVQKSIADISSSTDKEKAFKIWEDLQKYNYAQTAAYSKLGECYSYSVSSANLENMGTFQAPTFMNATLYK